MIDRLILSRIESLCADAPSLPNLPRTVKIGRYRAQWASLCDLFRSASAALHKSHRLALTPVSALLPLYCLVEVSARAGETAYLPLEGQCVRLLPRPHGLASSRFQKLFVTCCARAKNLLPPPRSKGADGRFRVGGTHTVAPRLDEAMVYYIYGSKSTAEILVCFLCA